MNCKRGKQMTEKFVRANLIHLKSFITESSLIAARRTHVLLGDFMAVSHNTGMRHERRLFDNFEGEWIVPEKEERSGIILYLHGGGYTCGNIDYARGFGTFLADEFGMRVFCCAYRLAPENPFPAAVEDALTAYEYLLQSGFSHDKIILCGESAGGGLCYALSLKLFEQWLPQPAGIVAISPWTDLTLSGKSHRENNEIDPSMTTERVKFFAECYSDDTKNPLVSPIFFERDKADFPPSIIFAGGDEVLLDDSKIMHKRLTDCGFKSELIVRPNLWHAYVLYNLREYRNDFERIGRFLDKHLSTDAQWSRLDNAALIFPASKRRGWHNVFRLSAELRDPVDRDIMQSALDVTVKRFPLISSRLRAGVFWYYLEHTSAPEIIRDGPQPIMKRPFGAVRQCAIRVLYYKNRIAVEFFHAVTDGNGGLIFLKTLLAEYLTQKYGVEIPNTDGVADRLANPTADELVDSFADNAGAVGLKRSSEKVYHLTGVRERDGFLNLTCGTLPLDDLLSRCREHGVTLTAYLSAVMVMSVMTLQRRKVRSLDKRLPVRVQIPVDLRRLFPSTTMRNFVMVVNVGVDPRMGDYTFEEVLGIISRQLQLYVTPKNMQAIFTTNVNSEKTFIVKLVPLFIKNIVMKAVFNLVGESQACITMSNLGNIRLPEEMREYVKGFDFIISPQARAPHNCAVCSYGNDLRINFIRRSESPELEREFFRNLVRLGHHVLIESNSKDCQSERL